MTEDRSAEAGDAWLRHSRFGRGFYNDYVVAGIIVALCALIYYFSTLIERVPESLTQGMQPASFPQGILVTILALVLFMLYEARENPLEMPEPVPGLAYKTMAAMALALAVSTWFDFFVGLIVFVVVCVPMWGMPRLALAFGYSLALHGVLFLLFATFLQVRFPNGPLTGLMQ